MSRRNYRKIPDRPSYQSGQTVAFRDALDIEEAAHGINRINARKRREGIEQRRVERAAAITLPGGADLAAWLRKETP